MSKYEVINVYANSLGLWRAEVRFNWPKSPTESRAADNLFSLDGLDWPVSGDNTAVDWGRRGMRATSKRVNIWDMVTA